MFYEGRGSFRDSVSRAGIVLKRLPVALAFEKAVYPSGASQVNGGRMSSSLNPLGFMFALALGFTSLLYTHIRAREKYAALPVKREPDERSR